MAPISIAEGRTITDPVMPPRSSVRSSIRSVLTAPVSGLALGFAELKGRGLCSVSDPQITLAFIPAAKDLPGSMVGEVFLASPTPRVNPVRAKLLAEHESRHVDQWAVFTLAGGIGLLPAAYLVDGTLYPGAENHFERAAGLDSGGYAPVPDPPVGPRTWAIALWAGVVLVLARRRIRWAVRTAVRHQSTHADGRCPVHTPRWT